MNERSTVLSGGTLCAHTGRFSRGPQSWESQYRVPVPVTQLHTCLHACNEVEQLKLLARETGRSLVRLTLRGLAFWCGGGYAR
jgi:hypothetical protein